MVDSFATTRRSRSPGRPGACVVQHPFAQYADQRNWALDHLPFRHPWVLFVDADERVTPELRREIEGIVAAAPVDRPRGYYVNRRFIFLGRWIRHAGWYPSWNLRLFRRRLRSIRDASSPRARGARRLRRLPALRPAPRRPATALEAFVARHNRYSTLEARARSLPSTGRERIDGSPAAGSARRSSASAGCASASGPTSRPSRWRSSRTCTWCAGLSRWPTRAHLLPAAGLSGANRRPQAGRAPRRAHLRRGPALSSARTV